MASSFQPPAPDELAAVDQANVPYHDHCVVVEGVVSPSGQGGWCGKPDCYDVHSFELAAWRISGEPLVKRKLLILRPAPTFMDGRPRGADDPFEQYPACSIQRFSVLLSKDKTRAVFEKALPMDTDQELEVLADRLRHPVIVTTERFGQLTLDPRLDRFDGMGKWGRAKIDIHLDKDDEGGVEETLQTAEQLWAEQKTWKRKVEERIVNELLQVKNEAWLDEGEAELTADEFTARLKLTSISVERDGRFTFWYDDGDMFLGHAIEVRANLKDGIFDVGLAG